MSQRAARGRFWDLHLDELPLIRNLLRARVFQTLFIVPNFLVFVILIWAGLVGNPTGGKNAAIIMVWIFWFFILTAVLIPVGGRLWCMMCPLIALGQWIMRLALVRKTAIHLNLKLRWPARLDNLWLQNIGFLVIATFSPIILTRPAATSIMLLLLIVMAIAASVLFQRQRRGGRIFCRYLDPIGGFIGLYSLMGALEVKPKDREVCRRCRFKSCAVGSDEGWGCPWYLYPGGMTRNIYCGLCTECLKTCPYDNMAFKIRPFAQDLLKERKMDEAFKSLIMLGCALVFGAVFFGWWGWLKGIADPLEGVTLAGPYRWSDLAVYAPMLWGMNLILLPGIHLLVTWLSRAWAGVRDIPLRKLFVDYAYALVPLGLFAWIGFVVALIMLNGSYVISIVSDPFGWGWNLLGTRDYPWQPYFSGAVPYVQVALLLIGLVATARTAFLISEQNFQGLDQVIKATVPVVLFSAGLVLSLMYLFAIV